MLTIPSNSLAQCNKHLYPLPSIQPHVLIIQPLCLSTGRGRKGRKRERERWINRKSSTLVVLYAHTPPLLISPPRRGGIWITHTHKVPNSVIHLFLVYFVTITTNNAAFYCNICLMAHKDKLHCSLSEHNSPID